MEKENAKQRLKKLVTMFLAIVLGLQICVIPVEAASQTNSIKFTGGGMEILSNLKTKLQVIE